MTIWIIVRLPLNYYTPSILLRTHSKRHFFLPKSWNILGFSKLFPVKNSRIKTFDFSFHVRLGTRERKHGGKNHPNTICCRFWFIFAKYFLCVESNKISRIIGAVGIFLSFSFEQNSNPLLAFFSACVCMQYFRIQPISRTVKSFDNYHVGLLVAFRFQINNGRGNIWTLYVFFILLLCQGWDTCIVKLCWKVQLGLRGTY